MTTAPAAPPDDKGTESELVLTRDYTPLPHQLKAHQAHAHFVLFGAAVGVGKSKVIVEHAFATAMKWPGIPILIGRYRQIDLERTTLQEWFKSIPAIYYDKVYGGKHEKATNTFQLINGSRIYFAQLKDWNRWMSAELGVIFIEEAHEVPEYTVDQLDTRLRWTSGQGDCQRPECLKSQHYQPHYEHNFYQVFMAANPSPGWLKRRFYDRWKKGTLPANHAFIPARTRDNPHLPPSYIDTLYANRNRQWVDRMLDGDWDSFEGAVFNNFNTSTHVWEELKEYQHLIVDVCGGVDWGHVTSYAHPTVAILVARLRGGGYLAFWEYKQTGPASEDFEQMLLNVTKEFKVRKWFADPTQPRATRALRLLGVPIVDAHREQGSRSERLNLLKRLFDVGKGGRPDLMVYEDCINLIDGIQTAKEIGEGDTHSASQKVPTDIIGRDDDEVCALGYVMEGMADKKAPLMTNTELVVRTTPEKERAGRIMDYRKEAKRDRLRRMLITLGELEDDDA